MEILALLLFAVGIYLLHWLGILGAIYIFAISLVWWHWILAHPFLLTFYVASYFLIGAAWSLIKWYAHQSERVRKAKSRYGDSWQEYKDKYLDYGDQPSIKSWIAFWPISIVWTIFDDPIRRIVERIEYELKHLYTRITDFVWR